MMPVLDNEDSARAWLDSEFSLTAEQKSQLELFARLLEAANLQQNLVAAGTIPNLWVRHIADSAQLLCHDSPGNDGLWIDLGSGPGLPGLVIAAISNRRVLLVESRALRARFLDDAVSALGLSARVIVAPQPLERVETCDATTISARAFAPLPRLLELSARFSTPTTRWLLPKGRNAAKELALLPAAWQKLFHVEQSLTDVDSGILVGTGNVASQRGLK